MSENTLNAPATGDPVFTRLPLDRLHESPFNPRRTFTDIDELAADIKAQGVLQPIVVRPIVPPLFDAGANTEPEAVTGHEIIFGHRRFRAARAAGLADIPVLIRSMTDAEARVAQVSENLSRKDVHPFEEAEGFAALMRDGISADQLAKQFGQSRSYIYGRLKLLQACKEIRDACLAGEIGSEVALLIARLRTDKLQGKALGYIRGKYLDLQDGGKKSFRGIQQLLKERFTLHIKRAIFDPEDATLHPAVGICSACPSLSGNAPEYQDLAADREGRHHGYRHDGEPDLCTDPDCFALKKKLHLQREAERLRADGKTVIDGAKAMQAVSADGKVKGAYVALKEVRGAWQKIKILRPVPVLIQDPRGGKLFEAVRRAEMEEAGVKLEEPAAAKQAQRRAYDPEAERREREQRERQIEAENAARKRLLAAVRTEAARRPRTIDELRVVLGEMLIDMDNSDDGSTFVELRGAYGAVEEALPTMTADQLALLLLDLVLVRDLEVAPWSRDDDEPQPLLALARLYGLDIDAVRAGEVQTPEPASTPSTAGAGAKKSGAKGKASPKPAKGQKTGPAAREQMDDAGSAGGEERDMLAEAGL
jgi:ParB/RepB/Spo0J family partition protein